MRKSRAISPDFELEFQARSRIIYIVLPPLPICRKARGGLFIYGGSIA